MGKKRRGGREYRVAVTHDLRIGQTVNELSTEAERRSFDVTLTHVLRDLRKREKPNELYHYTDAGGLHGVLKCGRAWASESRFLNDPDDCRYIFSLLRRPQIVNLPGCAALLKAIESARTRISAGDTYTPPARVFVASFSEARDDLDQWRSYAANGSGYAFCFDAARVRYDDNAYLVEVLYEEEAQVSLLRFILQRNQALIATLTKDLGASEVDATQAVGHALVFELERIGPLLKHGAYKHEREWRLFVHGHPRATEVAGRLKVRTRGQLLVPYVEFPLLEEATGRMPLRSVWIGPAQDKTRGVLAVVLLLRKLGYYDVAQPPEPKPFGFFPAKAEVGDGPPDRPYVFHSRLPYRPA